MTEEEMIALTGPTNGVRYLQAFKFRESGMTYREIGEKLGVSGQTARFMVWKANRLLCADKTSFLGLTTKTANVLLCDYKTREEVEEGVKSGEITPKNTPNLGKKGYAEILRWLYD